MGLEPLTLELQGQRLHHSSTEPDCSASSTNQNKNNFMFLICTKHTNKKNWSSNLGSVEETMDLSCILLAVPFLRNPSEVEIIQLQRILTYFFLCLEALLTSGSCNLDRASNDDFSVESLF